MKQNIYKDVIITSEYLLNQGINLLFSKEDFTVDNEIIALLDVSDIPRMINGKTIVIHEKFGIFFVKRTTKQLMNEFHKFNRVGFLLSKALMKYFDMKRNIPMVFGFCSYMPMSGGSRNCTDWIALHWLKKVEQHGTSANFETDNGLTIRMNFPNGNLHDRVHDVYFLSEQQVITLGSILAKGNMKMIPPRYVGLLNDYNDCRCLFHKDILVTWSGICNRVDSFENFLLDAITKGEIEADVTKEIYHQKIYRIMKLY
ncbi:hypothetical protein [Companilactobacillus jidongensis]|uniref:hypothetical protein n=1 Tax=Companilactobacillus jidongensis TaxID=2486006 RepID=UPI000F791839|nr:hypothetical protein [Companilactobacillus jidongensis]